MTPRRGGRRGRAGGRSGRSAPVPAPSGVWARCQVVCRRHQHVRPGRRPSQRPVLPKGGLDRLDRVEVPVLPQEHPAEHGQEPLRLSAVARQVVRATSSPASFTRCWRSSSPGSSVEEPFRFFLFGAVGFGQGRGRHVERVLEVHAHAGVEDPADIFSGDGGCAAAPGGWRWRR